MNLPKLYLSPAVFALLVALAAPPYSLGAQKPKKDSAIAIKANDSAALKANIGKRVAVTGKVVSVGRGPKDGMRFINFGTSKTSGFTAALVPAVYPDFPNVDRLVQERLRVSGKLEAYKNKPMIKVTRPSQVEILGTEKAKAKKKKKKKQSAN